MTTLTKSPRTQRTARVRDVRETKAIVAALRERARAAGITPSEALWQILGNFSKRPFALRAQQPMDEAKDGRWPCVMVEPKVLSVLKARTQAAGISQGEAVRQIVRAWLAKH